MEARFCPNCGSTKVEPDTSNRAEIFLSGGNPNKWKCRECNYTGLMPQGDPQEDLDREFSEEADFEPSGSVEKIDTGFGIAYFKYLVYVSLPLILVYIVFTKI